MATEPLASETTASDHDFVLNLLTHLVEPLGRALPQWTEVVVHDLQRLPDSIIAVHGDVTGRRIGDPATDKLLTAAASGEIRTEVSYPTRLPDGRQLRSTTIIVNDASGAPAAALCLNTDLSAVKALHRETTALLEADDITDEPPAETFPRDVDELAATLVQRAISQQGIPVDLMRKEHKMAVVKELRSGGLFLLRDAVEMIAEALQVTRFTIYNYLSEMEKAENPQPNTEKKPSTRTKKGSLIT